MTAASRRQVVVLHGAAALATVLLWHVVAAGAEPAALAPSPDRVESTDECRRCHFRRPDEVKQLIASDSFCVEEEAATWETQDKHRQAFNLLVGEQNRPLTEQILGFPLSDVLSLPEAGGRAARGIHYLPNADPQKLAVAQQCMACHAPIAEPVARGSAQLTLENGVSCQACHGPGRLYMTPHQDSTNVWRIVKADAKESLFGLRDLRNPVKRTALCVSCHVGRYGDGADQPPRFVKHEWYAKGHPPLPSFEYVAFSMQMPLHWRPLPEKLAQQKFAWYDAAPEGKDVEAEIARFIETLPRSVKIDRDAFAASWLEANRGSYAADPSGDFFRSKDVLVSSVGVLAAYASNLARVPEELRTDFSLYDCGACHHELRSRLPSEGRVRRNIPAGRLPPAYWMQSLARQAAERTPHAAEFAAALGELEKAFGARPFGERAAVMEASAKLDAACAAVGQTLASAPLDDATAAALLSSLAHPQHDEDRDYHAARQHAWAIRAVLADLANLPIRAASPAADAPKPLAKPLSPPVAAALGFEAGAEIASDDPRARQRIDGLFGDDAWHGPLRLRLPAGQQETIVGHLPESLAAIYAYDPAWFRERLKPIQAAFPQR